MLKKIFTGMLIVLVAIQFIRPEKNISPGASANAIGNRYRVPQDVKAILQRSCYDCHSNHTNYPWYNSVQPVAWLLAHDVNEGKEHLNFDEFNIYNTEKKRHKLGDLAEEVREDEMPMGIYTIIHRNAILSASEKQRLIGWADSLKNAVR